MKMNTQMTVPLQEDRAPDDSLMQTLATRSLSIMQSVSPNHFIRKRIIKKKGKKHARFRDELLFSRSSYPKDNPDLGQNLPQREKKHPAIDQWTSRKAYNRHSYCGGAIVCLVS